MSFDQTWGNAPVAEQFDPSQPPEPGIYTVVVRETKAFKSAAGDDTVVIELEGIDGAAAQREWSVLQGFKSEKQASFTKRVCQDLGVDIASVLSLDDLDTKLKEAAVGNYFTVEVKRNGNYTNTYITGRATSEPVAGDVPTDMDGPAVQQKLDEAQQRLAATPTANTPEENPEDIPF